VSTAKGLPLSSDEPKLYGELAAWWPLLSAPEEYAEEAAFYGDTLIAASDRTPATLLELGSGGGNNASHLKRRFESLTLVDPAPGMLAHSRRLNPECEHLVGDMRTVRLHREFDCVFVHDAVCYMTSPDDLRRAMETAFLHCRRGGIALFAPDAVRETFKPSEDLGGHDGPRRALRFLEWKWDPDVDDTSYLVDYAYLLREDDGSVRAVHDRHVEGLFSRGDWLRLLESVGFDASLVRYDHSELEPGSYELFLGKRP
jgi:SAM-dependent methyltransferase